MILTINGDYCVDITKQLVVAMKTDCVFCEVGTECLHNIYTTFRLGYLRLSLVP
jgi:hypothetical protein